MMSRTTNDVNISNIQRTEKANNANASLTVRVHADGNDSPNSRGFSILTPANTNNTKSIYQDSLRASQTIINTVKSNGIRIHGSGMYKRFWCKNFKKIVIQSLNLGHTDTITLTKVCDRYGKGNFVQVETLSI